MKFALACWTVVALGTFGLDIAYERYVPGYDGSDAAHAIGTYNQIAVIALIILAIAAAFYDFTRDDR